MKQSAPIYVLKNRTNGLKKNQDIPLFKALDEVGKKEGYANWSLLISKHEDNLPNKFSEVLDFLNPAGRQAIRLYVSVSANLSKELVSILGQANSSACYVDSPDDISAESA